ncbi:hypothetical protein GIB67_038571 [Kingdonia uniflora]|uniref:Protein FAR1-RELATED SEQUENCE n=1 Tax=Kingdonia uniflora TaxID=39325 RepID=A0A7J7NQ18_9MAGN|nr:hypothetical protein GIB67_038571 [Kingdonia uniflora]
MKVIRDESPKRSKNEHIVNPLLVEPPYEGKHFDIGEDARLWYERYGRGQSFSTKICNFTKHPRSKDIGKAHFCCMSNGFSKKNLGIDLDTNERDENKRSSDKCGCKAMMNINWNTKIVSKVLTLFSDKTFNKQDCYNHKAKINKKRLARGDAQVALEWFRKKQNEDPMFYFNTKLDEEDQILKFFWIDGRLKCTYETFGVVVTFNITYRTNVYKMPFALFAGINNHYQTIQYGCSLLRNEQENIFVWLFHTCLKVMNYKYPVSIIIDQDAVMAAVVPKVKK